MPPTMVFSSRCSKTAVLAFLKPLGKPFKRLLKHCLEHRYHPYVFDVLLVLLTGHFACQGRNFQHLDVVSTPAKYFLFKNFISFFLDYYITYIYIYIIYILYIISIYIECSKLVSTKALKKNCIPT